jgi:hypothetical protein
MIQVPVGWCAILTSLEHDLKDQRLHAATDPDHSDCQGGAAGCAQEQRETQALYHEAVEKCTGTEHRHAATGAP